MEEMNLEKKITNKKKVLLIIFSIILVLLLIGIAIYLCFFKNEKTNNENLDNNKTEDKANIEEVDKDKNDDQINEAEKEEDKESTEENNEQKEEFDKPNENIDNSTEENDNSNVNLRKVDDLKDKNIITYENLKNLIDENDVKNDNKFKYNLTTTIYREVAFSNNNLNKDLVKESPGFRLWATFENSEQITSNSVLNDYSFPGIPCVEYNIFKKRYKEMFNNDDDLDKILNTVGISGIRKITLNKEDYVGYNVMGAWYWPYWYDSSIEAIYYNQKTNNYSQIGFWSWIQGPENKKTAYGTYELEYYEKENNQVLTKVIFYKLGETS